MSEFFGSAWWLLVTLGLLVTLHEFGHYWVARRCGVKVLRFSIGFGKPLWSRVGRDGVEYAIGMIPLGGYVKFLDARESDSPGSVANLPGEYNAAPVWKRICIALAGPAANILFTIVAFWAMFVIGRPDFEPVIDTPQGLAAAAGLHAGDRIVGVDDQHVGSWSEAMMGVGEASMLRRDAALSVVDAQGQASQHVIALSSLPRDSADNEKTFAAIGLKLQPPPATAGLVSPDSPAERAGLRVGDRITQINDIPVNSFSDVIPAIALEAAKNPTLNVLVLRDGQRVPLVVTAEQKSVDGKSKWIIGVGESRAMNALERLGPLRAIPAAFNEMWKTTRSTFGLIAGIVTGQASPKNLSSVIGIAQVANVSAQMGLAWFLSFLAVISLSLGILNLLPIPILDGGHVLYYLIEWLKGSPVSERAMMAGQYVGMALLVTLMSVAFYNDIARLVAS
ncbi:MAG: RIP metalloprotease RseP [Rudaea sp.]